MQIPAAERNPLRASMLPTVTFAPKVILLVGFAIVLFTEGLYLPLLYRLGLPAPAVRSLLYLKYGFAGILFAVFTLRLILRRTNFLPFELLGLVCLAATSTISATHLLRTGGAGSSYTLFVFPFVLYFAGRGLSMQHLHLRRALRIVLILFLAISTYALVDIMFFGPELWRDTLRQGDYLVDVKGYRGGIIDGLIGNFFFDPYHLRVRRAVGTQGDPLAFAYAAVVPLCLLLYAPGLLRRRRLSILIAVSALLASMTRAIVVGFVYVVPLHALTRRGYVVLASVGAVGAMFALGFIGPDLLEILGRVDSSTRGHILSLAEMTQLDPVHLLVGAMPLGRTEIYDLEPGFFNVLMNYGIALTALFYGFIIALLRRLERLDREIGVALAVAGTIGAVTSFVFSESFFSFTGFGLFWFLSGAALSSLRSR